LQPLETGKLNQTEYDFLIVGAGWYGAVCARELTKKGYSCLVIDRRNHIGGNAYTRSEKDIHIHQYGAHIFHTNDRTIWDYVNALGPFNNYINSPLAFAHGKLYNLPFNMNTFYQVWGLSNPEQVKDKIQSQRGENHTTPSNLEEQAISLVGRDIYELFIKDYTEKQWGKPCTQLPPSIIKRLPVRFTFDNNYFNDQYQGIPENGYTQLFEVLLSGIDTLLGVDYFDFVANNSHRFKQTIYTGPIDAFFEFRFGRLEYRSLDFVHEIMPIENAQGNAVINYTTHEVPFTRTIEHRHFQKHPKSPTTVVTKEFPADYSEGKEAYYPINDEINQKRFKQYQELAETLPNVHFGGRLAEYRYYDMHQVIASALKFVRDYE
jgi:UDP-galactopyranose mutase